MAVIDRQLSAISPVVVAVVPLQTSVFGLATDGTPLEYKSFMFGARTDLDWLALKRIMSLIGASKPTR